METPNRPDMLERYKEEMRAYARKAGYTVAPPEEAPPVMKEPETPVETPPAELPAEKPGEEEPLFPVEPERPAEEPEELPEEENCSIWEEPAIPADAPGDEV